MIFFRKQWPGGPQEVDGVKFRPKREGSVFTLEAPAKHKRSLVALGWQVRGATKEPAKAPVKAPEPASEPAPAPVAPAATESPAQGDVEAAEQALSSNAKTVCKLIRSGKHDAYLADMLSLEKASGVGAGATRSTVIDAISKRMEEID